MSDCSKLADSMSEDDSRMVDNDNNSDDESLEEDDISQLPSRFNEIQHLDPKRYKKGIIYISFIPPGMNIPFLINYMSQYGKLGRIMLQPVHSNDSFHTKKKDKKKKKKRPREFSEGWIEFLKKRTAKEVAATLNNSKVGGKKSCRFHDYIWNLKYLPRFKWVHLSERLAYEKEVYKKRIEAEISQARKVASHFKDSLDKAERAEKLAKRGKAPPPQSDDWILGNIFKQKETDEQKRKNKKKKKKLQSRDDFLKNIFS